jgi:SAM-dependent methyltransferase
MKLYTELADWWPLLSDPADYADEAAFFWQTLTANGLPANPTLLELGSGGGNNALHLKPHFHQLTLTDLSPAMIAVSQQLNPDCVHHVGDLRTIRLNQTFDVVFAHDALDYMVSERDLQQAIATAFVHCAPGGLTLFVPDHVKETFAPDTDHGGHDGVDRALRYLEWTYDPDEHDTQYTTEYTVVLRETGRPTRVEHEQHTLGLFPRALWLALLTAAGFTATIVVDPYDRELFVARKQPSAAEHNHGPHTCTKLPTVL